MSFQLMAWASKQSTGSPTRKAVLLALANRANHDTGQCNPSIERIAEETEYGERAVRQALADLVGAGLITRSRPRRADGSQGVYEYQFPLAGDAQPAAPRAGRAVAVPRKSPAAARAAEPVLPLGQEQTLEPGPPKPPMTVDRRPVTLAEADLAAAVLGEWNAQANQLLRSVDWLKKIILRIREHPDLGLDEHAQIIQYALKHPWWKGEPGPSVVYGNGALFEQHLTQAAKGDTSGSQGAFQIALKVIQEARRHA